MSQSIFSSRLDDGEDREAVRFAHQAATYGELGWRARHVAEQVGDARRVAVWMLPTLESCVGVVGTLLAPRTVIPISPKAGSRELSHIFEDSRPDLLIIPSGAKPPPEAAGVERLELDAGALPPAVAGGGRSEPSRDAPAMILYTSGTTGPPKGVVMHREALISNLDALARAWQWTDRDVLVHGLPLFHVHGLVLGVIGALRRGGRVHHVGRFSPAAIADALSRGGTMVFGVPTMYSRLAEAAESDERLRQGLASARLLVSGSAPLPAREAMRIERLTGQRIVERYGLTETLIACSVRCSSDRRPGYVGPPLDNVDVRIVDEAGEALDVSDDETIGELLVRGRSLFSGYLNRPDATAEALRDGWFHTGDLVTRAHDGYVRVVGRKSSDMIKSGGFKVGAGEVESAILEHPDIIEAAVTGEPDDDLGEQVVAYVVVRPDGDPSPEELSEHVQRLLARHKCPRRFHVVEALPRNEMGKVMKKQLTSSATPPAERIL